MNLAHMVAHTQKLEGTPLAHTVARGYRRQAARHRKAGLGEWISLGS